MGVSRLSAVWIGSGDGGGKNDGSPGLSRDPGGWRIYYLTRRDFDCLPHGDGAGVALVCSFLFAKRSAEYW